MNHLKTIDPELEIHVPRNAIERRLLEALFEEVIFNKTLAAPIHVSWFGTEDDPEPYVARIASWTPEDGQSPWDDEGRLHASLDLKPIHFQREHMLTSTHVYPIFLSAELSRFRTDVRIWWEMPANPWSSNHNQDNRWPSPPVLSKPKAGLILWHHLRDQEGDAR